MLLNLSGVPTVLSAVALGVAMLRSGFPARWAGWLSLAVAAGHVLGIVALARTGFFSPTGGSTFDRSRRHPDLVRRRVDALVPAPASRERVTMLDHLSIQCADVDASRAFYDAVLEPLGGGRVMDFGPVVGYGVAGKPSFWIGPCAGGEPIAECPESRGPRRVRGARPRRGPRLLRRRRRDGCRGAARAAPLARVPPGVLRRVRARSGRQQRRGRLSLARKLTLPGSPRRLSTGRRRPASLVLVRVSRVSGAGSARVHRLVCPAGVPRWQGGRDRSEHPGRVLAPEEARLR